MVRDGWVYMTTNKPGGVIYIGVTSNLGERMDQHVTDMSDKSFVGRYNARRLVWYEYHDSIDGAIEREKQLKNWKREWKVELIEEANLDWEELEAPLT